MQRVFVLLWIVCLSGCAVGGSSPAPSPRPKTDCSQYIGGYGACTSSCDGERRMSESPLCSAECKQPFPPKEANCSATCAFEHIREIERENAYRSCMQRCDTMPFDCRV